MISTTPEQRKERFEQIENTGIIDLYSSPESGRLFRSVYTAHHLELPYRDFVVLIGEVILGFHPLQQLPQLFIQQLSLPEAQAVKITNELLEHLSPLLNSKPDNEMNHLTPSTLVGMDNSNQDTEPIHVMQSERDLLASSNTIPASVGYQEVSQESAVPRYQKPLTDTPSYNDTDPSKGNLR